MLDRLTDFRLAFSLTCEGDLDYEEVHESLVVDIGGGDLHERICGGTHAPELQKKWQELPDER